MYYIGGVLMKISEYQKFQNFKQRHDLNNQQIIKIITEYANTEDEYSASFFSAKYNISTHIFYRLKDFALIFMLVDSTVCKRVRNKSLRNQIAKKGSGNYTASTRHYQSLIEKRKEYLKSFSNEEIVQIASEYAYGDALYDIAKRHDISPYTVRKLLAISLANRLVCDDLYQQIKLRSQIYTVQLHDFNGYTAENLWNYSHWE